MRLRVGGNDGARVFQVAANMHRIICTGYGSSAVVYAATFKPAQKRVAIKMLDLDAFERNHIDELRVDILVGMQVIEATVLMSIYLWF